MRLSTISNFIASRILAWSNVVVIKKRTKKETNETKVVNEKNEDNQKIL